MVIGTLKLDSANAATTPGGQSGAPGSPDGTATTVAVGEPNQITATFTVTPYLLAAGEGVNLTAGAAAAPGAPAEGGPPTGPPSGDAP